MCLRRARDHALDGIALLLQVTSSPAVHHHVKDELGDGIDVLVKGAHDHHGLHSASLQVSVVARWHTGEVTEVWSRTENLMQLSPRAPSLWARSVDQCGSLRHLHELFLVNGYFGLWPQRHDRVSASHL